MSSFMVSTKTIHNAVLAYRPVDVRPEDPQAVKKSEHRAFHHRTNTARKRSAL